MGCLEACVHEAEGHAQAVSSAGQDTLSEASFGAIESPAAIGILK